jgi:hypothetical protein
MKRIVHKFLAVSIVAGSGILMDVHAEEMVPVDSVAAEAHMPREAIKRAKAAGIDMTRVPASPGLHIVPLDQSPFVGSAAGQAARELADQAAKGAHVARSGEVPDLRTAGRRPGSRSRRSVSSAPHPSLESIRPRLRYEPISVRGTILEKAPLSEATTAGGLRDGRWTGVTRAWEVPGLGYVQLDESEYRESGGSITVVQEWLNTDVNGTPASIQTKRERRGKALVALAWVTDSTVFRMNLQPLDPAAVKSNEEALLALARSLGG